MSPQIVAAIVAVSFGVIFTVIMVFDYFLYTDKVERNSITQVIIDYSKKYSAIPFFLGLFVGFLFGHLYG